MSPERRVTPASAAAKLAQQKERILQAWKRRRGTRCRYAFAVDLPRDARGKHVNGQLMPLL